ncbi:unnamed protein product, partial [Phaeothamnion confervicola]
MSEGAMTSLRCLHCGAGYCGACLHGDAGKMPNLAKCAGCGLKPRTKPNSERPSWHGAPMPYEATAGGIKLYSVDVQASASGPALPSNDTAFLHSLRPSH